MDYDYYFPLPPPLTPPIVVAAPDPTVGVSVNQTYIPLGSNNMTLPSLQPSINPDMPISTLQEIQINSLAVPFSGNSQIQVVGVSSISQSDIIGVQPNPTFAGNTPIYATNDSVSQQVSQWSLYPAVSVVYASTISTNTMITNSLSAQQSFISSIINNHISTLEIDTGNIFASFIDIDGQILTADQDQLFLNGLPVATTANISSIQNWALYDAVSTVILNNNDITDAKVIYSDTVSTNTCEVSLLNASDIYANYIDTNYIQTNFLTCSTMSGELGAFNEIDVSTLQFNTGSGIGILTTDAPGTTLLFNNAPITTGNPASNWSAFPATQTVDFAVNTLSNVGNFLMPPSLTKSFNLGGGTVFTPINQNKQYSVTTNIVSSSPVTPLELTGVGGMNITAGSIGGVGEFNISLLGTAGNDLNITAPDINLTMTDPASFMNLTAPGGVAVLGGGGFFMASGVFEVITGLDCSLLTLGNIRIGSGNVLGATTQLEKWEFNDGDVTAMNGFQYLNMSKTRRITNDITVDGGDGRQIFESVSQQSNTVSQFTTRTKQTEFVIDANARGVNMGNVGSNLNESFSLNLKNLGNILSLTYLSGNGLTFGSSGGDVQLNGVATINATTRLAAPLVIGDVGSFSTLNVSTIQTQSINVSTITAVIGTFSDLFINNPKIHLGSNAGNTGQGASSVAIGAGAGNVNLGSNSVAIGTSASANGSNFINTLVLNASGATLNPITSTSMYVAPIRQLTDADAYGTSMMRWNSITKEVSYAPFIGDLQVVATSATAINLIPTVNGKTYVLTGTTTQNFLTTSLTIVDFGWFCILHNGNATNGGDINLTGMTGTTIIHEQKSTQNGGNVYLFWDGTSLIGY